MVTRKQQGFTIIEVVLVLAIAGLIFLMVFIALPALQRGQRDTQRRSSLSTFSAQVTQYQTNHKGAVPAKFTTTAEAKVFTDGYMQSNWTDPTGDPFVWKADIASLAKAGDWTYTDANVCATTGDAFASAGARNFAVAMKLEGAGIACMDNK